MEFYISSKTSNSSLLPPYTVLSQDQTSKVPGHFRQIELAIQMARTKLKFLNPPESLEPLLNDERGRCHTSASR